MDFVVTRGEPFKEDFNFKNADGTAKSLHGMEFEVIVERGLHVLALRPNKGLTVSPLEGKLSIDLPGEFTQTLPFNHMKYTLAFTFLGERTEVTSGKVTVLNG